MFPKSYRFIVVLLSLVATLSAQQEVLPVSSAARIDAKAYLAPLPSDGVVSLKTISSDFATNQNAAAGKYSGKRITVIGRISHLGKGHGENKVMIVKLQNRTASLPAVRAEFLYGALPQNSELEINGDGTSATLIRRDRIGMILSREPYLSMGQKVGIKGNFNGLNVGDIVLTNCKVIPKEKLRQAVKGE